MPYDNREGMLKLDPELLSVLRNPPAERGMIQRFFDGLDNTPRFVSQGEYQDQQYQDQQSRARARAEGERHLRQLLYILHGGRPSRDPNFEPPVQPEPLANRGRAQRQPPIIGVRG